MPCIAMIESKLGILDLLDEESRLPSGTDNALITKLCKAFATPQNKYFEKPRFSQTAFIIKHYAIDVVYEIEGFLDKNKDTVSDDQLSVISKSKFPFLVEVTTLDDVPVVAKAGVVPKKPTLGSIFKNSLMSLTETIRSTESYYIRCIKPNQKKLPFDFEPQNVVAQLRACGVLETIRIYCAGYPTRMTFHDFIDKYFLLVPSKDWKKAPREITETIVRKHIKDKEKFDFGLTKVFLRSGVLGYMEKMRKDKLNSVSTIIQKNMRRYLAKKHYKEDLRRLVICQAYIRGFNARRNYQKLRKLNAATIIQKYSRKWKQHHKYKLLKRSTIIIQSAIRIHQSKLKLIKLRRRKAAIIIQKNLKGYVIKRKFKKTIKRLVLIQSCIRRRIAKKKLKALKAESKSFGKLKDMNYNLEGKVVELAQVLKAKENENKLISERLNQTESHLAFLKDKLSHTGMNYICLFDYSSMDGTLQEMAKLKKDINSLQEYKAIALKETEKLAMMLKKKEEIIHKSEEDLASAKLEIKKLKDELKASRESLEDSPTEIKAQLASLQNQMKKMVGGGNAQNRKKSVSQEPNLSLSNTPIPRVASTNRRTSHAPHDSLQVDTKGNRLSNLGPLKPYIRRASSVTADKISNGVSTFIPSPFPNDETGKKLKILLNNPTIEDEIIGCLITNLRLPTPNLQTLTSRREIFFPSNIIGIVLLQMVGSRSDKIAINLVGSSIKAIRKQLVGFPDDCITSFWFTNVFELFSILTTSIEKEQFKQKKISNGPQGQSAPEALLTTLSNEYETFLMEIYSGWCEVLKTKADSLVTPAIIEHMSLPGYLIKSSGPASWAVWGKNSPPVFTIDQLLNFFGKLIKTMRCYFVDDFCSRALLSEMLRVMGINGFNQLMLRKNFCTWKRGVQVQYNVARLEEWCHTHGVSEGALHIQQLLQASKLLTLNKTSPSDIDTLYDVCFLLTPGQVKKLLSLYYQTDVDSPLAHELMRMVNMRAAIVDEEDLLLDNTKVYELDKPVPREVGYMDRYVPKIVTFTVVQDILAAAKGGE